MTGHHAALVNGTAVLSPRTCFVLIHRLQIRALVVADRRHDGYGLQPEEIEILDLLAASAALHQPGRSGVVALVDELANSRPHGRSGRPQNTVAPILLSAAQVATRIQRSERQVRRLIEQRHLAGRKIGNSWKVTETDLEDYLAEHPEGAR